jgi:signal transduction histidine kinase
VEADAERRRIERSLHDGVQQHLVALAVNLQLARQLVDSDPSATRALLDDVADDMREALESVRALAQTIYPPLLLDRGLAEALRAAAAAAGSRVRLEVETSERYPAEVEAAVYFGCSEALKVGGTIRVWRAEEALRFEVTGAGAAVSDSSTIAGRFDALGAELVTAPERLSGRIPIER